MHGKQVSIHKGGRNTESFNPVSTLVRPAMRVLVGRPPTAAKPRYDGKLKHDDVVIVPEFFCAEDDWSMCVMIVASRLADQRGRLEEGGKPPPPILLLQSVLPLE